MQSSLRQEGTPESEHLFGLLDLRQPIFFAGEALGQSIPIKIGGVPGELSTPGPANWDPPVSDPLRIPLTPPRAATRWKFGETPMNWGRPASYPEQTGEVERLLLQFQVATPMVGEMGTRILQSFGAWKSRFFEHLELLTKHRRDHATRVHDANEAFDLFLWSGNSPSRPFERQVPTIELAILLPERATSLQQLVLASDLASADVAPPLEYKLLLEAYTAYASGDFRMAVIEAASAAELAITNLVRAKLANDGIAYVERLLSRFRMLGGRFELAELVGAPLPPFDVRKDLIDPRNDVVHKAAFANAASARKAIAVADALVDLQPAALYPSGR